MTTPAGLPNQPRDDTGPIFREAWEAQAFALTLSLHQRGVFTWPEWATSLSDEIRAAQRQGDPDLGDTYYHHWLKALEGLVAAKGVVTTAELDETTDAWLDAAHATPHGQPIELVRARRP